MKRPVLIAALAALAVCLAAGCGGGGGGGSAEDPAAVAPPTTPLFIGATLRPRGEAKANVESLVGRVAGIDDIGSFVATEIERAASSSGDGVDFDREIEPWLGERAGLAFSSYDGDDFEGSVLALQTTDADAARAFVEKRAAAADEPAAERSYDGVDFELEGDDGQAVGMIGDLLVLAEDGPTFKRAVDASGGDSLAGAPAFADASAAAPAASIADLYLDLGGLTGAGASLDPDARRLLDVTGIDPAGMVLAASLVPGPDELELALSVPPLGAAAGTDPAAGEGAANLLGSLPRSAVVALASGGFGEQLRAGIDKLDASGIPGEVPPHQLKQALATVGVDIDRIAGSLQGAAVFLEGSAPGSLGGALVLTTRGGEAQQTVAAIGSFLRQADVAGVTPLGGGSFAVRSEDLGSRPLVVRAGPAGDRIVVAYGSRAAARALAAASGAGEGSGGASSGALAGSPLFGDATAALGGTPIGAFADLAAALRLLESLLPADDRAELAAARPYLRKASFAAGGVAGEDGTPTAKLIVGFAR